MIKEPKFKTETGFLTKYALHCGYIQSYECKINHDLWEVIFDCTSPSAGIYRVILRKNKDILEKDLYDNFTKAKNVYLYYVRPLHRDYKMSIEK